MSRIRYIVELNLFVGTEEEKWSQITIEQMSKADKTI